MKVLEMDGRLTVAAKCSMAKLQVYKEHLTTPLFFQLLNGHLMTE